MRRVLATEIHSLLSQGFISFGMEGQDERLRASNRDTTKQNYG